MSDTYKDSVIRYVITHVGKDGLRTLSLGAQGRYTYPTEEAAKDGLKLWAGPQGLPRVLTPDQVATLEVRACECWPGHFDPCGIYFD